jgi:hypothetical protein
MTERLTAKEDWLQILVLTIVLWSPEIFTPFLEKHLDSSRAPAAALSIAIGFILSFPFWGARRQNLRRYVTTAGIVTLAYYLLYRFVLSSLY